VPQAHIDADPSQCMLRGVRIQDFEDTVQVYLGSLYVNDFNLFGRTWQVNVQADFPFRERLEDLSLLQVRNRRGAMVPLGSLAGVREVNGPLVLTRYNMYPAASINGAAAPGTSSGEAIAMMGHLADAELPQNMAYEWTDMSYLELLAGNTAMVIFGFAVVMVFLVLAAQYESWSLPLAVILVVPMCLLSAIAGVNIFSKLSADKMDINIFTRIGFVVLVGLASKNAILIVEFAKVQRHAGKSRTEATLEACRLRLRPIVMTSLAFILGVVPLILATGAGAEMRRTLGVAVFSGMLGVTLFGVFLTPVFFFTIDWLSGTHLFTSPAVRRVGKWALLVVTLGVPVGVTFLRRLPAKRGKETRRPGERHRTRTVPPLPALSEAPAGNGHPVKLLPAPPDEQTIKLLPPSGNGSNGHGETKEPAGAEPAPATPETARAPSGGENGHGDKDVTAQPTTTPSPADGKANGSAAPPSEEKEANGQAPTPRVPASNPEPPAGPGGPVSD
jgi:multidrug efflux pump